MCTRQTLLSRPGYKATAGKGFALARPHTHTHTQVGSVFLLSE